MTLKNLYYKDDTGAWKVVQRPYVKRNNVWTPAKEAWVKSAGVWKKSFEWDITPPAPPVLELELRENLGGSPGSNSTGDGRFIAVVVRMPGTANDPDVAMIRVLVGTATAYPSSWAGSTHIKDVDRDYPYEFWSDWVYNAYQGRAAGKYHPDTSVRVGKNYPPNATTSYNLPGGRYYHFQAWAMDHDGNWSGGTPQRIWVPKSYSEGSNIINKSANFIPITATYRPTSGADTRIPYTQVVSGNPVSHAWWGYGGQLQENIGHQGTPTILSAQIYMFRKNDSGAATANVYLGRSGGDITGSSEPAGTEIVKLGTINKGQGKWFSLPASYLPDLQQNIRSLFLYHKAPTAASHTAADYLELQGNDPESGFTSSGRLYVRWTEKP